MNLRPGVLAVQEISHGASMGGIAEPGHIQVLGVELYIKALVGPEARPDSLLDHLLPWDVSILAAKDQNPFRLSWLSSREWLKDQKEQKRRRNRPTEPFHMGQSINPLWHLGYTAE